MLQIPFCISSLTQLRHLRSFAQHSLEVIEGHGLDVPIYLIYPIYILQCPVTLNS